MDGMSNITIHVRKQVCHLFHMRGWNIILKCHVTHMRNIIESSSKGRRSGAHPKTFTTKDTLPIPKFQSNPRVLGFFESSL